MTKAAHAVVILLTILTLTAFAESPGSLTNTLSFFPVSDKPIPGGRYVDTTDCPKLGYISNSPSLVITGLQSVVTSTAAVFTKQGDLTGKSEPAVDFTFFSTDAKRLGDLTTQNVGRRLLFMVGDRPLMAPLLKEPFETPTLKLALTRYKDPQVVVSRLKALVHE
jgi:hypothetical protein